MNESLFDCLPQSGECSSYITSFGNTKKKKTLRKLNCIATRISKVTESRWVGQSPSSRCFIPSRSKNSSGEVGSQRRCWDWLDFISLWTNRDQTQHLCVVSERWRALHRRTGSDTASASPCFNPKGKSFIGHIGGRLVQTVFRTTIQQNTHAPMHTHIHAQEQCAVTQTRSLYCTYSGAVQRVKADYHVND